MYLIIGVLINRYGRGIQSMPELIPNHSFWADFPFLVKVNIRVNYMLEFCLDFWSFLCQVQGLFLDARDKNYWFGETILVWHEMCQRHFRTASLHTSVEQWHHHGWPDSSFYLSHSVGQIQLDLFVGKRCQLLFSFRFLSSGWSCVYLWLYQGCVFFSLSEMQ